MAIKKVALLENIVADIVPTSKIADDDKVQKRFQKVISELKSVQHRKEGKRLVPKVDDFLYASCIMMHAAEASLIDQETGEHLKNKNNEPVVGSFVEFTDHKGASSVKWESADGILPYKNGNGDIFPEEDLLVAYKEWVGKPLCKDHVSDSIDGVRGVIVDTHYDPKFKRVHALFALDRVNYSDLARKVEAGYATSVSMGTAVGRSICTDCGNAAETEAQYCSHVRNRTCYGEVNKELDPIELSIVVTGADPKAKIKTVLAHLKQYEKKLKRAASSGSVPKSRVAEIDEQIHGIEEEIEKISSDVKKEDINSSAARLLELLGNTDSKDGVFDETINLAKSIIDSNLDDLKHLSDSNLDKLIGVLNHLDLGEEKSKLLPLQFQRTERLIKGDGEEAVQVGQEGPATGLVDSDGNSLKSEEDLKQEQIFTGGPGDVEMTPEVLQQFSAWHSNQLKTTNDSKRLSELDEKIAALTEQLSSLQNDNNEEKLVMTFSDLKKKALERKAYHQGTEDPAEVLPYERLGDDEKIREEQDRQMTGDELDTSVDNPDEELKKMLSRAEITERSKKRQALLEKTQKSAAKAKEDMLSSKAYHQGTEDPAEVLPYDRMGDDEKIRKDDDRQMNQDGEMEGEKGMAPGDADKKKDISRLANIKLSMHKGATPAEARWDVFSGDKKVLSVIAGNTFGDSLEKKAANGVTFSEFFTSKAYGVRLGKLVLAKGVEAVAEEFGAVLAEEEMPMAAPDAPAEEMPMAEMPEDSNDELEEMRNAVAEGLDRLELVLEEMRSSVEAPASEGLADVDVELGENPEALEAPLAAVSDKDVFKAFAFMSDMAGELAFLKAKLAKSDVDGDTLKVAKEATEDAKEIVVRAKKLVADYKRCEAASKKQAGDAVDMAMYTLDAEDLEEVLDIVEDGIEDHEEMLHVEEASEVEALRAQVEELEERLKAKEDGDEEKEEEEESEEGEEESDKDEESEEEEDDCNDKLASRKARRAKMAAAASKLDDVYMETRKGGGPVLDLEGDSKIETLHETHEAMMEIAHREAKGNEVKMAAEKIDAAVKSGSLEASKLPELAAMGTLDADAVAYWKNFYGQADGGSDFAGELVKDFKKEASVQTDEKMIRMKRAFQLGLEAQEKGLIDGGKASLNDYVDSLMGVPDATFASMKRLVRNTKVASKQSGYIPQVGVTEEDVGLTSTASVKQNGATEPTFENLARVFMKK